MIAKEQISEICLKIVQNIKPYKVILFGSYVTGNNNEDSDLDLIIVKDSDLPKHKRGLEIQRLFYGYLIPMDFKIYTPSEFNQELQNSYSFLNSAMKDSKLLYERQD